MSDQCVNFPCWRCGIVWRSPFVLWRPGDGRPAIEMREDGTWTSAPAQVV